MLKFYYRLKLNLNFLPSLDQHRRQKQSSASGYILRERIQ